MTLPKIPKDAANRVVDEALRRMGMGQVDQGQDRYIALSDRVDADVVSRIRAMRDSSDEEIIIDLDLAVSMDNGPAFAATLTSIKEEVLKGGFRFIGSRSALRLAGIILGQPLTGPERIQIEIINECRTGCCYCWNNAPLVLRRRSDDWLKGSMALSNFRNIIKDAVELDVEGIILTGRGEPAQHPRSVDMCRVVSDAGLHLTVQLHIGAFKNPKLLVDAGINRLLVHVPALKKSSFLTIHGEGAQKMFSLAGGNLRELARLHSSGRVEVIPNMVINPHNAADLEAAVQTFSDLGFSEAYFRPLVITPELKKTGSISAVKKADLKATDRARKLAGELGLDYVFPPAPAGRLKKRKADRTVMPCGVGYYFARITVEGDAHFCCNEKEVGTLTAGKGLKQMWTSHKWNSMRSAAWMQDSKAVKAFIDSDCSRCMHSDQKMQIMSLMGEVSSG